MHHDDAAREFAYDRTDKMHQFDKGVGRGGGEGLDRREHEEPLEDGVPSSRYSSLTGSTASAQACAAADVATKSPRMPVARPRDPAVHGAVNRRTSRACPRRGVQPPLQKRLDLATQARDMNGMTAVQPVSPNTGQD